MPTPPFKTLDEHPKRFRMVAVLCEMHGVPYQFFDRAVAEGKGPRLEIIHGELMAEMDEFEEWVQNLEGARECN